MRKLRWAAALIAPVLTVMALEAQWVGYAAYLAEGAPGALQAELPQQTIDLAVDPAQEALTLLAVGDIANCPEHPGLGSALPVTSELLGLASPFDPGAAPATKTVQLARSWPKAPILALGDLVYSSGKPVEFSECFDPLWGAERARTLPSPGNHEYKTQGAFGYFDYWAGRAGPDHLGYYAARDGNWLILSLNSEIDAGPGSAQARWLNEVLDGAPGSCVLAFYHKPAYSLAPRKGRENAVALFRRLEEAGATLVLNGHNHFYERTVPLAADGTADPAHGTIAFTVGTGGETSRELTPAPTTAAAVFGHLGLLRLELGEAQVRWWFEGAEGEGVLDAGSAPCNHRSS